MEDNTNEDNEKESVIPGYANVNEFSQQTLKAVLLATKSSNDLPVGDDFDFYSTYSSVRDVLDMEGQRILSLLQRILRHQNVKGNIGASTSLDLDDRFDVLMDTNDQILERAGTLLDEASGVRKQEAKLVLASTPRLKVSTSWNQKTMTPTSTKKSAAAYHLLTARNIQRPQVRFKDKIDNSDCPAKLLIREKPNALKSLEDSLKLPETVSMEESERPNFCHPHPYGYELEQFAPGVELLTGVKPQKPNPTSLTPLVYVDTADSLRQLMEDLRQQKEIAVDLEHHSYRSFLGLTCLMQISTRSHDYIVDTLELREELYVLNEVFTDPKITKVFHGADSDMIWLQRDFGVYVVNMFDTGQAARVLRLSGFSLAHLLRHYCHVEADKQFQLADWRIRPLPEELIKYAREDTHYLLYIYDLMRNQLLDSGNKQANLLQSVYTHSKLVASQVYRKPAFSESDHIELLRRSRKTFNSQQLAALKDLFRWRNQTARSEDESLGYVLPNHMLLQIAEILPREHQGVLACCNPIPPLVRQNLPELHKMVLQAREITISKVEKVAASKPSVSQHPKYDADSLLHSHHDMSRQAETIADIENNISETGLIADSSSMFSPPADEKGVQVNTKPNITAFSPNGKSKTTKNGTKELVDTIIALFANPFTKYLAKDTDDDNVIKPARKEMWILKRKAEDIGKDSDSGKVDLDSFEPEYAPPSKKPKIAVNLTTSKSDPKLADKPADGRRIFDLSDAGSAANTKKEDIKQKITSKLQTLREEVSKAKKRLKEVEASKKNKNNSSKDTIKVEKTDPGTPSQDNEKGEERKKRKKNNQKQNNGADEKFEGFDYEAAEKQLKEDFSKEKKKDIYNPKLPSFDKKKKQDKKGKGDKTKGKGKKTGNNV